MPITDAHIPVSASLLWSQRNNPSWLPTSTFVARFQRSESDPSLWESTDGHWTAELRRAPRRAHVYLAIWRDGLLLGTYDERGWHDASPTSRVRRRPPAARRLGFAA